MKVQAEEAVEGVPADTLLLGRSSWDPEALSLKYGWRDKNGKRARGGEIPLAALPQAVVFAAHRGYLTREQVGTLAKGLVDVLSVATAPGVASQEPGG